MATFSTIIESTLPPSEAFAYMATFSNAAEWDPGVVEASRIGDGELGRGSAFHVISNFAGRRVALRYEIVEIDPGRRVVLEARKSGFASVDTIIVAPAAGGSQITYEARLTLTGVRRVAEPLLRLLFRRVGRAAENSLRARLTR